MLRLISVTLRALQKKKEVKRTLAQFQQWKHEIDTLPKPPSKSKKILIIRLDDIGDYLLFRNTLPGYKQHWPGYEITLLGFTLWQSLFDYADAGFVDKTIWINKHECLKNPDQLKKVWQQLRNEGFEIVVCPSRIRPLLLDDLFTLAASPLVSYGSQNDFREKALNAESVKCYTNIFDNNDLSHEFTFNQAFAKWLFGNYIPKSMPEFPAPAMQRPMAEPYLVCFVGASFKSRRWTTEKWIDFIHICKKNTDLKVVIAGGKNDLPIADEIVAATNVQSITGKVSLVEMANWIAHSVATISNDTMAAHLSVALGRPTVIVASGDNFYKFSDYGGEWVSTVYPDVFYEQRRKHQHKPFRNYVAVTKDIGTIKAEDVFEGLEQMIDPEYPAYNILHPTHNS